MSDKKRTIEESSKLELTSDEIISKVREIITRQGNVKEKQRYFRKTMPEFAERYPALFNMACDPEFDSSRMERLEYMLRMRDNVSSNKISQHNASVKVGENLYTEYVKPLVDKTKK